MLDVEQLDARIVPTTFRYSGMGASISWDDPGNWTIVGVADNKHTYPHSQGDGAKTERDSAVFSSTPAGKRNDNRNAALQSLRANVTIPAGLRLRLDELSITNAYTGTITINASLMITRLYSQENGVLAGQGDFILGDIINGVAAAGSITGPAKLSGAGRFRVAAGSTLTITPERQTVTFDGRVLDIAAGTTVNATDATIQLKRASITNKGTFTSKGETVFHGDGVANTKFVNDKGGTFNVTNDRGRGDPTIFLAPFDNLGTVNVQSPMTTLDLRNGGTSSGSYNLAARASLRFDSFDPFGPQPPPTFTWDQGMSITGTLGNDGKPASNLYLSANIKINGARVLRQVEADFTKGTIQGTLHLRDSSILNWSSGAIDSGNLRLTDGTTLNLSNSPTLLTKGSIINWGTINLISGTLSLKGGAKVGNYSLFDIKGDASVLGDKNQEFQNSYGILRKSGGTGMSKIDKIDFVNEAKVEINSGTLKIPKNTQKEKDALKKASTTMNGGKLDVDGQIDLKGGILENIEASQFDGEVIGDVFNIGGAVNPGGAGQPGKLTIDGLHGYYFQRNRGSLNIDLAGPVPGSSYDQLVVTGEVGLAGRLNVNPLTVPTADEYVIIDNQGALPVSGQFAGLPNRAMLTLLGEEYQIRYDAGDGNDVVLSRLNPPPTFGTITLIDSSVNPSIFGQPVAYTANVLPDNPAQGTPTGTVAFKHASPDGSFSVTLGTALLDANGQAMFVKDNLVPADHSIFAVYQGDDTFASSSSETMVQTVYKADTEIRVDSFINPSVYGQSGIFGLAFRVVPPGAGAPTGMVTLYDSFNGSTTILSSGPIGSPGAFPPLEAGVHTITAVYSGDDYFNGSTSAPLVQTVTMAETTVTLTSSANPMIYGEALNLNAFIGVVPPGGGMLTGTVTFWDTFNGSTTVLSSGLLGESESFPPLAVGVHSIVAVYSGDGNFYGSMSDPLIQTVLPSGSDSSGFASILSPSSSKPSALVSLAGGRASSQGNVAATDAVFQDYASADLIGLLLEEDRK